MAIDQDADPRLGKLRELREKAHLGGGIARIEQQHQRGKLTARERLDLLLDKGTFREIDPFVTIRGSNTESTTGKAQSESVVTGYGMVEGRQIFVYAQDFTVYGGSLSEVSGQKICKVMDFSLKMGCPLVGLNDSGGARIQEGVVSLAAYGEIFLRNTLSSGVVPQISIILGPAAGGACYSPGITDFVFMVNGVGQMYITGPDVIKSVTGEDITHEELGGAIPHSTRSGVSHFISETEEACFIQVRSLLGFLPSNNLEDPPMVAETDDPSRTDSTLGNVVPANPNRAYDVRDVIAKVMDGGEFMEVHQSYAPNIVVGYARLNGRTVGVVSNQPNHMAGVLDINASMKASRFVRFCDSFNIPLVTFVDVPGFMPGTDQEYGGIIKHGAKLLYAYSEATVPKLSVILRKAYGGAYIVMSSKHLRGDINLAWPSAEIAVMGPEGAVNIIDREQIAGSQNPEETRANLTQEYRERFANPYVAASRGYLDDVIDPAETRPKLIQGLEMLKNKRVSMPAKKHGNIPL